MYSLVKLYDTTLRDGNQSSIVSFTLEDKIRIAEKIEGLGIRYIEGGWPNPTHQADVKFFKEAKKRNFKADIVAFGSTRKPDSPAGKDLFLKYLLLAETPIVTLFGKSWDLHVRDILGTNLDRNLQVIESSVAYLKKRGRTVIYDAEHFFDGYKADGSYALKTLEAALAGGADSIVLCDTNGGMLPMDVSQVFAEVRLRFPKTDLGIHTHNDSGNAVANSLMAVSQGATQVQGTINGLGERCGNANLCALIPDLVLKMKIPCVSGEELARLTSISLFVSEIANLLPDARQPFVGENAFAHKGGAHIDGVLKNAKSFEHENPAVVGNERRYVLSDQAGRSAMVEKIKKVRPDIKKSDPLVQNLLREIKEREHRGYQFEAAEGSFQLLVKKALGIFKDLFEFKGFRVIVEKRENGELHSEATIKVKNGKSVVHTAAEGDGPVDALNNAVRKALTNFYPKLQEVRLEDFKVRILDGRDGTGAVVRVLIESHDGKEHWGTIGVSPNIIEASWIALIESLSYKIMKK